MNIEGLKGDYIEPAREASGDRFRNLDERKNFYKQYCNTCLTPSCIHKFNIQGTLDSELESYWSLGDFKRSDDKVSCSKYQGK